MPIPPFKSEATRDNSGLETQLWHLNTSYLQNANGNVVRNSVGFN